MTAIATIIRNNQTLYDNYHHLKKKDIVCGRIRLHPGEEHLLTDLVERGITLIPSATAQVASRSKTFQARIFSDFMLPGTLPIYDPHTLLRSSSLYQQQQFTRVILKCDRKNGGLGVHVFNSIEDLYNQVSGGTFSFPFVIQPFQCNSKDIRVIILGNHLEAYERLNPYNFRKNLHCGGESKPFPLSDQLLTFCRQVMGRGNFPYAHLDLMLIGDGDWKLTEINLRGGLKGAKIKGREYQLKLEEIHEKLLAQVMHENSLQER